MEGTMLDKLSIGEAVVTDEVVGNITRLWMFGNVPNVRVTEADENGRCYPEKGHSVVFRGEKRVNDLLNKMGVTV